jgi:hypothetical protein
MKRTELIKLITSKSYYPFNLLLTKSKNELEKLYEEIKDNKTKPKKETKPKINKREIRNIIYNKAKKLGLNFKYNDNINEMKKAVEKKDKEEYIIDNAIKTIKDNRNSIGKTLLIILRVNDDYMTVTLSNYKKTIDYLLKLKEMSKSKIAKLINSIEAELNFSSAEISASSVRSRDHEEDEIYDVEVYLKTIKKNIGGNFFPYLNTSNIDLSHCGIYNNFDKNNYSKSCFHLALIKSKLFTEDKINMIKHLIINEFIPKNKIPKIAKLLEITIILKYRKGKRGDIEYKHYNKGQKNILNIGLLENHYFINNNNEFKIIEKLFKENKFIPMADNHEIYDSIFVDEILKHNDKPELEYSQKSCSLVKNDSTDKLTHFDNIFYADYESTTDGEFHKSYMVCLVDDNNLKKSFTSNNHTINFLDFLKKQDGNFLTYFHNLGYDYQFFIKYVNVLNIIKNGSIVKQINCLYKGRKLIFRDSFGLIPSKLDNFNKMFGTESKKSYLPHNLFTNKNLIDLNGFIPLTEAMKNIPEEHHKDIIKYEIDGEINLIEYASDYCINDCITLRDGLNVFKKNILPLFKINNLPDKTNLDLINSCISTPSLVFKIMKANEDNLKNIYSFSHNVQKYLSNFVVGGRVMMKDNKKQYIKQNKQISSLDANSLYPAAFIRIKEIGGFLMGKPKILENKTIQFLNSVDGYFVRIKITKINKTKPFPILSIKDKTGIRDFTNKIVGEIISVDKFTLEDAIIHHDIEFEIIDGYYFNEGRNDSMCVLVEELYSTRLRLKAEKNPLENIYKLLLNSLYGKFIESDKNKLVQLDIIKEDKYEKFIDNNYNRIKEFSSIGKDYNNKDVFLFKSKKIINNHFNCQQIGIEILSMSKRIMNEVFELANENNIEIFYQDTDSLKMLTDDVDKLNNCFKSKYNKELLGNSLGQFKDEYEKMHCDVFIAVGKKFYYSNDKLKGDDKISCKGIPLILLKNHTNENGKLINTEELFTDLYHNKKATFSNKNFDKVMFKHNKNLTISNNKSFKRTVHFMDKD